MCCIWYLVFDRFFFLFLQNKSLHIWIIQIVKAQAKTEMKYREDNFLLHFAFDLMIGTLLSAHCSALSCFTHRKTFPQTLKFVKRCTFTVWLGNCLQICWNFSDLSPKNDWQTIFFCNFVKWILTSILLKIFFNIKAKTSIRKSWQKI